MNVLEVRQLNWTGHESRADEVRQIKHSLEAKPEGQRPRGEPKMAYVRDWDRTMEVYRK